MFKKLCVVLIAMWLPFMVVANEILETPYNETCQGMQEWLKTDFKAADTRWREMVMENINHHAFKRFDVAIAFATANMPQHQKNGFAMDHFLETLFITGKQCKKEPTRPIMDVYLEAVEKVARKIIPSA